MLTKQLTLMFCRAVVLLIRILFYIIYIISQFKEGRFEYPIGVIEVLFDIIFSYNRACNLISLINEMSDTT